MTSSRSAFLDADVASVAIVSSGAFPYGNVVLLDQVIITGLTSRGRVFRTDVKDAACGQSTAKVGPDADGRPGGCDNIRVVLLNGSPPQVSVWTDRGHRRETGLYELPRVAVGGEMIHLVGLSAVPYRCGDRPPWLYHGSQALAARLEPRASRGFGPAKDRLCAVYASHEESYAAAFAVPLVPDARGNLEWSLQYTNEPRIIIHAGAPDPDRVGYVYRVPADRFVPLDDLQWVSYRSVVPQDYRVVDAATSADWIQPGPKAIRNRETRDSQRKMAGVALPCATLLAPEMSTPFAEPKAPSPIDFTRLWQHVVAQLPARAPSLHGPDHWIRVEHNGIALAGRTGADLDLVRLFALFHDSQRQNDAVDPGHGARGAELASKLRGVLFDLTNDRFELLRVACSWHTDHLHHEHPTIATCWDADRLDLGRVGIVPEALFMSTDAGREMAADHSDRVARPRSGNRPRGSNWIESYGGC